MCGLSKKTPMHIEPLNHVATPSLATPPGREFVTLPPVGGDAVCGLSRSFWYAAEKSGAIQLTRVRLPGRQRGRFLLPVPQALALLKKLNSGKAVIAAGPGRPAKKDAGKVV
jgi:hypothetical protein